MTRKRSLLMLFIIFGLSIILLSQCTKSVQQPEKTITDKVVTGVGKNNDTTSILESQTLKVTVSMQPAEFALLQKQSDEYTKNNEDIHVELKNIPDGYSELKKANQMGDAPDLMLMDNLWVNEFAALGFLRPIDEFFTGEQQSKGIMTLMNQVKWNGYMWAIPKDVDPYILVWNKDIAKENKWQHAPESAEEWIAWNKTLMHPELGKFGIYINPTDPYAILSVLSSFTDEPSQTSYLTSLRDPLIIKKIESFFVPQEEIYNAALLKQNYPAFSANTDPWILLRLGTIAAMVTTVSEYKEHESSYIELAALKTNSLATYETINNGLLKGRSYAISSRSKNEILAINWIKEMTSVGTDLIVWDEAKLLRSIPTAYLATPISNDANSNSYSWLINHGKALPVEPETNKKISTFKNEWNQVWQGKQNFSSFLESSAKLWIENKSSFSYLSP
ncbi:sugar ABC transporter substrate-binding protein [Paenibacillus psychroresistens]|uniref:sugar ABC transporter substrate-binding protein n=1 Tax=Paenibacillus psychroresistens TaxID=1778678 RepID=UPI00139110F0|nr:extracellular solute-binding protein [Paenibacillus psychroresistens]